MSGLDQKFFENGGGRNWNMSLARFAHQETVAVEEDEGSLDRVVIALHAKRAAIRERRDATNTLRTWEAQVDDIIADVCDEQYSHAGWDGYDADPLNKQSISFASQLLKALPKGVQLPMVDPSPNGLLGLYWEKDGYQLLLDINPEGVISYAFKSESGLSYTGRPSFITAIPKGLIGLLKDYFKAD